MPKYLLAILGLAGILSLGLVIDVQSHNATVALVPPTPRGAAIHCPGRIEGRAPETELRFELVGRLAKVLVSEGQLVSGGEPLLVLEATSQSQELALAAAEMDVAEGRLQRLVNGARQEERDEVEAEYRARLAEMKGAQQKHNRIMSLRESGAVTQQEADDETVHLAAAQAHLDAARARRELFAAAARPDEARIAKAGVSAAKARWELARHQLDKTMLKAPHSGQVLKIDAEIGELTGPQSVSPAVVMADTSRLFVRAFIDEIDAPLVRLGMRATVTADGLAGRTYAGTVARLSPRMTSKQLFTDRPNERFDTKVREVCIELNESEDLVVGLRVDVVIEPIE
jgi:ABC exporter DevB family membrane fusion protein